MFTDPLDKDNMLRRIADDEAIDGFGRLYEVREKYRNRCDGSGFFAMLAAGAFLLIFL
jgi:hypothetical protein